MLWNWKSSYYRDGISFHLFPYELLKMARPQYLTLKRTGSAHEELFTGMIVI